MKLLNYKEWEFVKEIRATNVLGKYDVFFYLTGALMYGTTLAFYVLFTLWAKDEVLPGIEKRAENAETAEKLPDRYMNMLYTMIGLHSAIGLSVLYDAVYVGGKNIFLQTFIIGAGTFNTILWIFYITLGVSSYSDTGFFYAMASFASACVSNAMMLALLFAIFHSGARKNTIQGQVGATSQSRVGSLAF